jgi:hypothetical protein
MGCEFALSYRRHCKKRHGHCGNERAKMTKKDTNDDFVIHTIQPDGATGMRLLSQLNRMKTCGCTHAGAGFDYPSGA